MLQQDSSSFNCLLAIATCRLEHNNLASCKNTGDRQQRWHQCWSRLMDLLIDLAIDLPIRPPPVTDALSGWMFIVDCMCNTHVEASLTERVLTPQHGHGRMKMNKSMVCLAVTEFGIVWQGYYRQSCFIQILVQCMTEQREFSVTARAQHHTAAHSVRILANDSMLRCWGSGHLLHYAY